MVSILSTPANKTCTCYQCKCVLQYQYNDMRFSFERDYTGDGERKARIQCPNCGYQQSVPTSF